ncbi:hypothetical protein IWZ03DRAFT_369116 [Phyllosticta citriasiana]|uniref:Secreted protein n=1 Tax=Phyllosticta citriasiana TaxID=595635 RepID=A0ABR1KV20_9PEZI
MCCPVLCCAVLYGPAAALHHPSDKVEPYLQTHTASCAVLPLRLAAIALLFDEAQYHPQRLYDRFASSDLAMRSAARLEPQSRRANAVRPFLFLH